MIFYHTKKNLVSAGKIENTNAGIEKNAVIKTRQPKMIFTLMKIKCESGANRCDALHLLGHYQIIQL